MEIRHFTQNDFDAVAEIYRQGIATGIATFETSVPSWDTWDENHLRECRIAAFDNGEMVGWCALTKVSGRCVYAGVAEVSVYVGTAARGKGVGDALLQRLITESEELNYWTLQAGIFEENVASINLHLKNGFRIVGYRECIGKQDGVWKNNVILERRSKIAGHD